MSQRVAIIGAGAAGLAAAVTLQTQLEVLCFEESAQLGGRLRNLNRAALLWPPSPALRRLLRAQILAASQQLSRLPLPSRWQRLVAHWRLKLGFFTAEAAPAFLIKLCEELYGEPLKSWSPERLDPLFERALLSSRPELWIAEISKPSEWLAVSLARALKPRVRLHTAERVEALRFSPFSWQVVTQATEYSVQAVLLALPPAEVKRLIARYTSGSWSAKLARWPLMERWKTPLPLPYPVTKPLMPLPFLWCAGEWCPPAGAFPGIDGAVASGVRAAEALLKAFAT